MSPEKIYSGFNLSVDQGIAEIVGIDSAFIFNHIVYWLKINSGKEGVEIVDGKYWMYETNKKMSEFFGFYSEEQISKAIKKLKEAGLIEIRNLSKNPFDRTLSYTVYDQSLIKKRLRDPEIGGMHTRKSAESEVRKSAECIYTTEEQDNNKKQQQAAAAVPLKKTPQAKIYECLKNTPVAEEFSLKITKEWKEDQVKNALEWSTHRDNPPKKSYEASITYALQHGLSLKDIQPSKEEYYELNKSYAMKYHGKRSRTSTIECCNTYVEFVHNGVGGCAVISYTDKDFNKHFGHELMKNGFPIE